MKDCISLAGFMGSGKTSVGKALLPMLGGYEFIDLDSYIEAMTGRSIPEIFENSGEGSFRQMEQHALEDIFMTGEMLGSKTLLSLGGGTLTNEACARLIRRKTECFYLRGREETLLANIRKEPGSRPLLPEGKDQRARLSRLLAERVPVYEATAHHIIDIDGKSVEETAVDILMTLQ